MWNIDEIDGPIAVQAIGTVCLYPNVGPRIPSLGSGLVGIAHFCTSNDVIEHLGTNKQSRRSILNTDWEATVTFHVVARATT